METKFSDYKTVRETAAEWSVTGRRIVAYINAGRIPGAVRAGNMWMIPKYAVKPSDGRVNNRRHPKNEVSTPDKISESGARK